MNISDKRKAGEALGRDGLSERIIALAKDIAEGSYKNAIEKAGHISVLVEAASYDTYWHEKAKAGRLKESDVLVGLIDGWLTKDKITSSVNTIHCGDGD